MSFTEMEKTWGWESTWPTAKVWKYGQESVALLGLLSQIDSREIPGKAFGRWN